MNRLDLFEQAHKTAMNEINMLLEKGTELSVLLKWMLETDANPYNYLPDGWAGALSSSTAFSSLASMLSHALCDDGDITFAEDRYGYPCIIFADRYDVESEGEYKVINVSPSEFIEAHDNRRLEELKKHFVTDAAIHGVEFAVQQYSSSCLFDPQWTETLKDDINKMVERYSVLR